MTIKDFFNKSRQPKRHYLTMVTGLILFVICYYLLSNIDNRFVFSIDSMEFRNKPTITIGAGSDLTIKSIPHDFMTITHNEEGFAWSIDRSRDTLYYYLINGDNPNRHEIKETSAIHTEFMTETGNRIPVYLKGKDIIDCATKFKDTQYSLLRNMVSLLNNDSISKNAKTDKTLASVIRKNPKTNSVEIIILDNRTLIDSLGYTYNGLTSQLASKRKDDCKVQFFAVSDMTVRFEEADHDQFLIDDINYMVKPVLIMTEWGAGHYMLRHRPDNTITVNYPKSLMYVERLDTIDSISCRQSGMATLKQDNKGYLIGNDIYIPTFCQSFSSTVCHINVQDNSIQLESNGRDSFLVNDNFHMIPTFQKACFSSGDVAINCRYGILDMKYILSYLLLPILFFLLIIISHLFLMRKSYINKCNKTTVWAGLYSSYLPALALIALCYCIGKIMISLKLSYTYPYFEKLTGIVVITTSLTLLLFYLLSLLINFDFIQKPVFCNRGKKISKIRLFIPCLVGVIGLALAFIFIHILDNGINHEVRAAYFPEEWFTYNVLNWTTLSGINDTHRSVFYTLFLTCCVITFALFVNGLLSNWEKYRDFSILDTIDAWFDKIFKINTDNRKMNPFILLLFYLLKYIAFPALLIYIVGLSLKGNFATAFITLFAVIGLTRALSGINPKEGAILNAIEMLLASLLIMLVAFLPDHGYFTNYFGFFGAVLFFYFFIQKSQNKYALNGAERKRRGKEEKNMFRIGLVLIIFVICTPFIYNYFFSSDTVNYNRSSRRFLMATQFEQYRESGYRYADSDAEFMNIIFYYMNHSDGHDPLSNETHHLHPSISSGQSPVILNDVSLPSSFLSSYGRGAYLIYFMLLVSLLYLVITYSLTGTTSGSIPFDRYSQWRILAVLMWTGSSLYLFMSYYGVLPFTGRLNPGFGVDAVGEALESCILLSYMSATTFMNKEQ